MPVKNAKPAAEKQRPINLSPEELADVRIPMVLTESFTFKVNDAEEADYYGDGGQVTVRPWTPHEVAPRKSVVSPLIAVQYGHYRPIGFATLKTTISEFSLRDGRHDYRPVMESNLSRRVFQTWAYMALQDPKFNFVRERILNRSGPYFMAARALAQRFGVLTIDEWWKVPMVSQLTFVNEASTGAWRRSPRKLSVRHG